MTFKTCITFLFIILCLKIGAQTFQATYGGMSGDEGTDICLTDDGGYLMAGSTTSFGAGGTDAYLIKINSIGGVIWSKTFGGSNNEEVKCIQKVSDGGYIIAGNTYSFGSGNKDCYLIKTDMNGILQWSKTYGDSLNEGLERLIITNDGGYLFTGTCDSNDSIGDQDVFLLKTDANGLQQWFSVYHSSFSDQAYDVKQTSDNGYVLTGKRAFTGPLCNILILKTDSLGTTQWSKTYGTPTSLYWGTNILETNDGGYLLLATRIFSLFSGGGGMYIIKTDSAGTIGWEQHFDDMDDGRMKKTNDGGYSIGGYGHVLVYTGPWTLPNVYFNSVLLKIDTSATTQWAHRYHGAANATVGYSACETIDGGFALIGRMDSVSVYSEAYFVKTDSAGNSWCSEVSISCFGSLSTGSFPENVNSYNNPVASFSELSAPTISGSGGLGNMLCYVGTEENISNQEKIQPYPNPTTGKFNFLNSDNNSTIRIYDCIGKLVLQTNIKDSEQTIDISNEDKGIYFYRLENKKGEITYGKIILQ